MKHGTGMKLTYVTVRRVSNGYIIDTNWDWGYDDDGNSIRRPREWEDPKVVIQDVSDEIQDADALGEEIVRLFATQPSRSDERAGG